MRKENLNKVQILVLCVAIAFLFLISVKANAQTSHVVDTVKYHYFDLNGRIVDNSFFYEKTMGWCNWFLAYDGIRTREVWISTME